MNGITDFRGEGLWISDWRQNVVVIFGAARGIGAAIAQAFAAEGAHVAAIDRDPSVHDLARSFPQSLGLVADVTDYAAVRQAAQEVAATLRSVRPRRLRRRRRLGQVRLSVLEASSRPTGSLC